MVFERALQRRHVSRILPTVVGGRGGPQQVAMTDLDDVLLNSSQVAEILDLSPDTVNEFARKSVLPGFKKGRQWRFRKRDVASYKRQLRGTTAA